MANNDYGERIDQNTVRFVRRLPGPIDRVWSYLTVADKRRRWLCDGETELRTGGNVDMKFHNASLSSRPDIDPPEKYCGLPEHMAFSGTVTRIEPPRLLCHTWEFEGENSEVCYELTEIGREVELVLTHRRLADDEEMLGVSAGWHTHLDMLADVLAGREPCAFWRRHTELEEEYEKRLG